MAKGLGGVESPNHASKEVVTLAGFQNPIRIRVLLDGMENDIGAWSLGEQWNGFEMPLFEEEQVRQLQAELVADPAGPQVAMIKGDNGAAWCEIDNTAMGDEPEMVPVTLLKTDEGTREVYAVGAGSWTWWRVEAEDE